MVSPGDHGPVNINRSTGQRIRHQHHRPANRLNIPVPERLSQRPQPDPRLIRDEVDAHPLTRRIQAPPDQEGGEPFQHDPLLPDRFLGPAGITQHRQHTIRASPDICLSHHDHLCIRSQRTHEVILRRPGKQPATQPTSPNHPQSARWTR